MIGYFKSSNPVNFVFLLVYAFVLRWHSIIFPHIPVPQATDGFLYLKLLAFLKPVGDALPLIYPLIVIALTVLQAVILNNRIVNEKLLAKQNYLPALAYLFITSFFPEWWQLSSALIINSLMVWVWGMLTRLYNNPRPKALVFNAGMVVSIASFLYFPALGLLLLIFSALIIFRPFQISEWLVAILGLLTPYYFLFAFLFLGNNWNPLIFLPAISISVPEFPAFQQDWWRLVAVVLLIIPFFISGFLIQGNILRMLIQVRKSWSLMLFYLIICILIPFINFTPVFEYWILCALPFAAFHSYTFFYTSKKWLQETLHWLIVAFILSLNLWMTLLETEV